MRVSGKKRVSAVAVTLVAAMGMGSLQGAAAGTRSIVPVSGTILEGSAPSQWDADVARLGCEQTGFTPIVDGKYKARDDAFDNGLVMGIDGTGFDDKDGLAPGAPLAKESLVTVNNADFPSLKVQRTDRVLPKSDILRTLMRFTNTDASKQTLTLEWDSDLGSDTDTQVRGSSSGDASYGKSDRWAVSSDSDTSPADPVLTWVLFGKGAATKVNNVVTQLGNGQTCFTVDFSLTVPAGASRYLLLFTEMNGQNAKAVSSASKYDSVTSRSPLLAGIKRGVQSKIANWAL